MEAAEEFTKNLINIALTGKHNEYEQIIDLQTLSVAKVLKKSLSKVVNCFRKSQSEAYNDYIHSINKNTPDVKLLMQYKTMKMCYEFYSHEKDLIDLTIDSYISYLHNGHIIDALLGRQRTNEAEDGIDIFDDDL